MKRTPPETSADANSLPARLAKLFGGWARLLVAFQRSGRRRRAFLLFLSVAILTLFVVQAQNAPACC